MKFGAHLSISGGYDKALDRIKKIGGNCLQIFSGSPRSWTFVKLQETEIEEFKKKKKELGIDPVYFHASYLVNLADKNRIGVLSKKSLINEMNLSNNLDIKGSIIHLGSFKNNQSTENYHVLIKNIQEILDQIPKGIVFIIENAGNKKIGQKLADIAKIVKDLNNPKVRVCLDTCHLFASGYDISTNEKLDNFLKEFDREIGLDKLELFHINDSKDDFSSGRDRHANIGQGRIGLNLFETLLNNTYTKNLPFIIETPGFDDHGPDKKNLDILKSLVKNE